MGARRKFDNGSRSRAGERKRRTLNPRSIHPDDGSHTEPAARPDELNRYGYPSVASANHITVSRIDLQRSAATSQRGHKHRKNPAYRHILPRKVSPNCGRVPLHRRTRFSAQLHPATNLRHYALTAPIRQPSDEGPARKRDSLFRVHPMRVDEFAARGGNPFQFVRTTMLPLASVTRWRDGGAFDVVAGERERNEA